MSHLGQPERGTQPAPDGRRRLGRPATWWAAACAIAVLVVVASVVAGSHKRRDPRIDVLDEAAHYGYVAALRHHHVPAWGETLDQRTLRMADCLGYEVGTPGKDCSAHERSPGDFAAR